MPLHVRRIGCADALGGCATAVTPAQVPAVHDEGRAVVGSMVLCRACETGTRADGDCRDRCAQWFSHGGCGEGERDLV